MTFLKKLGAILAKAAAIAIGIGPIVTPFLGSGKAGAIATTATNDLVQIGQIVATVEAVVQTPGSGAQKLAAAVPLVKGIIQSSELVIGKKIANELLFEQACTEMTQAVVDLLNSIDQNEVKTA